MEEKFSVLICDDSVLARKKLKNILFSCGVETVYEAVDGEQAVKSYEEKKPTIVFMDIVMPVKDGVEAVREIIAFDKDARIIMFSSVGTQDYLKEAIKAGARDFLQKPVDEEYFATYMKKLIEEVK